MTVAMSETSTIQQGGEGVPVSTPQPFFHEIIVNEGLA